MRPSATSFSIVSRAISRRTPSKLETTTAFGVSSMITSTPVRASSARMLRPSRPMIRPFISSPGSSISRVVVSLAWVPASRDIATARMLRARRSASRFISPSIWIRARPARCRAGRALIEIEGEMKRDAERRARNILAVAMSRLAGTHASETTTRLIELPGEEMKGRIIGREGRNIRALEALTGVDVIIDETPNAVVVSSFDGVRREIARLTIEKLVADGRIQPAAIEEVYSKARAEVEGRIVEAGEKAGLEAGLHGIDPELLAVLGRLRFRTSYGQIVLDHLVECAKFAGIIAAELGASVETAKRAALLHDIGKAVSHEVEGSHAAVGATMARRHGESEAVAHAIEAHHL